METERPRDKHRDGKRGRETHRNTKRQESKKHDAATPKVSGRD